MLIDLYLQGRLDLDRFVSRDDRPRRGRGGVPQDGAGRGPALRRRALSGPARSASPASAPTARTSVRRGWEHGNMEPVPELKVESEFQPAGDQPQAIAKLGRGHQAGRPVPDPARHHRLGQERHHRLDHRAGPAADADPRPQQVARRPAGQRVPRVLPQQPGRVLRQLLRLLPARGLHRRRATRTSRRTRRSTTRSTGCATRPPPPCSPGATSSSSPRCLHLRPGLPRGVPGPAARPAASGVDYDHAHASCAGSSTCSTTATT